MCVFFTLIKTNEIYQLMSLYRKNESINIVNMTCDEYILICANQMLENQCLKTEWVSQHIHQLVDTKPAQDTQLQIDYTPNRKLSSVSNDKIKGANFKNPISPILVSVILNERILWINSTYFSRAPPVDHLRSAVPPIHRNQPATQFVPLGQAIHRQTVQTWHGRLSSVACSWLQATVNR